MDDPVDLALELARAFLDGPWNAVAVAERGAGCLDRWPSWMEALAMRIVAAHRIPPAERPSELVGLIIAFLAERMPEDEPWPEIVAPVPPVTRPARLARAGDAVGLPRPELPPLAHRWPIAEIDSVVALAERLELTYGQLAWLADVRGLERSVAAPKLRNYRYRLIARPGGVPRLVEIPKARLKEIQRWMLREILDAIPVHPCAHGFTRGRSVVGQAWEHIGAAAVLRLDLRDFFASVTAGRVFGIFRTAGYPRRVAHVLTGLATNVVPLAVWAAFPPAGEARLVQRRFWLGRALATPHLPQGAPSSPVLANLAAFRLDRRLAGLAAALDLRYTRYADDLTFSGRIRAGADAAGIAARVAEIARSEGFALNPRKSSLRTRAARQTVCGVVVNDHPNVSRLEYERLKALLHNVARDGPVAHNRAGVEDFRAHIQGRIAWVASLNPARGEKLWARFAQCDFG